MIIHRISVEGFRVLGNRIIIDFPQQGIVGIFGRNESGKSTLFDEMKEVFENPLIVGIYVFAQVSLGVAMAHFPLAIRVAARCTASIIAV